MNKNYNNEATKKSPEFIPQQAGGDFGAAGGVNLCY
jgi:hypothetical protein